MRGPKRPGKNEQIDPGKCQENSANLPGARRLGLIFNCHIALLSFLTDLINGLKLLQQFSD